MRHRIRLQALVMFLGLIALVGYDWSQLVADAQAIPAFARKYGFSCNVCHVPGFPKLNDTGKCVSRSRLSSGFGTRSAYL
ncbi:MAG: hypothetical protein KF747_12125 [Nitrospira sp.]|nr:hypothetical protein [Nitrospira sp.]